MSNNISEWEELVAKIRAWDRSEHDWAASSKSIDHVSISAKERFIKTLMLQYDLKKK